MMTDSISQRLAVDIGGTFTDVVLEQDGELMTSKVLTTPTAEPLQDSASVNTPA